MPKTKNKSVIEFDEFVPNFLEDRMFALVNDVITNLLPAMWKGGTIDLPKLPYQINTPHDGWSEFVKHELQLPEELSRSTQSVSQVATFSAVLICMIHLDLFTSLYTGNIKAPDPKKYAKRFMGYDPGMTDLIYLLFRHKIAHFGLPPGVIITNREIEIPTADIKVPKGRAVTWAIYLGERENHMTIESFDGPEELIAGRNTPWAVRVDYKIYIEIQKFLIDLTRSVYGTDGYLAALKSDNTGKLRKNFKKVIKYLNPPRYSGNAEGWEEHQS